MHRRDALSDNIRVSRPNSARDNDAVLDVPNIVYYLADLELIKKRDRLTRFAATISTMIDRTTWSAIGRRCDREWNSFLYREMTQRFQIVRFVVAQSSSPS